MRAKGRDIRISSSDVCFVKSLGNYIEIHTETEKIVARERISNFLNLVPDKLEYLQVQRSYIIRIDHVKQRGVDVVVICDTEIKIGEKYRESLDQIQF